MPGLDYGRKPAQLRRKIMSLAAIALSAGCGAMVSAEALAQATVVRSSGPSAAQNKPGRKVPKGGKIVLKAKDTVTVLGKGGTRVLRGPGEFTIGEGGAARGERNKKLLAYITRSGNLNRVTAGAVRGDPDSSDEGALPAPSVWFLELDSAGPFCHVKDKRVIMWRPLPGEEEKLLIVPGQGGDHVVATFGESSRIKSWPQDEAPLDAGTTYMVIPPGTDESHELSFVAVDALPEDPEETAALLIANGCAGQLDRLLGAADEEGEQEGED